MSLSEHVGHKVKVTGTTVKEAAGDDDDEKGERNERAEHETANLQVRKVGHLRRRAKDGLTRRVNCPGCEATMHPSREVLSALASEKMATEDRADVLTHVVQCDSCGQHRWRVIQRKTYEPIYSC